MKLKGEEFETLEELQDQIEELVRLIQECIKSPASMKLPPRPPQNLTLERFGRNSKSERQLNMTKIETPHQIV
jgi:hypothetical protein